VSGERKAGSALTTLVSRLTVAMNTLTNS